MTESSSGHKDAARLFELTKTGAANEVADRTWRDLSMDAVFSRVDRCETAAGRQHLYRRLRTPATSTDEIERFDQRVTAFENDAALAVQFKKAVKPLDLAKNKHDTHGLAGALYGAPVELPRTAPLFRFGPIAAVLSALLVSVWPYAVVLLVVCVIANIALRISIHGTMTLHAGALGSVAELLSTAQNVTALKSSAPVVQADVSAGRAALSAIDSILPSLRWLTLDILKMNEMTAILITYLNVVFLLDVNAFIKSVRTVEKHRPALKRLFEMVGELDVARAVAQFRQARLTAKPRFLPPGSPMTIDSVEHPLLDSAVANDVRIEPRRGWLIMGSNMSGKSTFLRAVALQAILAQAIACVTAAKYEAPVTLVRTLMHVEDDLLSGRSHFLVEAEGSRDILIEEVAEDGAARLCVVDELFRGTNTADRVAAGSAFLRAMSKKGALVVAATHDSELIEMLGQDFRPHFFQETIEEGALKFDYVLHEGAVAPRNAIAVLELVGYPKDVLEEARARVEQSPTSGHSGASLSNDRET